MRHSAQFGTLMAYQHRGVVERFLDHIPLSPLEAEEIFNDLKMWLWLVAHAPSGKTPTIFDSMRIIDEMWHDFILFTRAYSDFCADYLDGFIDHYPHEKRSGAGTKLPRSSLRDTIELTVDHLGPVVAMRWFRELPRRYSPLRIVELKVQALVGVPANPLASAEVESASSTLTNLLLLSKENVALTSRSYEQGSSRLSGRAD